MKRYKRYVEDEIPSDLKNLYGKILFGGNDPLLRYDIKKIEPNTNHEKFLLDILRTWIKTGAENTPEIYKIVKELQKIKKYAPKILDPIENKLFRGIFYNFKKLGFDLKKSDFSISNDHSYTDWGRVFISNKKYIYKPHYNIQSWTPYIHSAITFLDNKEYDLTISNGYNIILFATLPKNELLFNPKFMNKVGRNEENEIIHIGKTNIKVNFIINIDTYNLLK